MSDGKENCRCGIYDKKVLDYLKTDYGRIINVYIGCIREELIGFNLNELWLYMKAQNNEYEKTIWIVEGGNA